MTAVLQVAQMIATALVSAITVTFGLYAWWVGGAAIVLLLAYWFFYRRIPR